jgi:hypothetical protein
VWIGRYGQQVGFGAASPTARSAMICFSASSGASPKGAFT